MAESNTTNMWYFLEGLARRRGLIIGVVVIVTLAAVVISLLMPKWYEAEALLLPPKDTSLPIGGGYTQLAEVVSITGGLNLPIMVTPSDVYARMLSSRTIVDRVIKELDLQTYYKTPLWIDTYLVLMSHSKFRVTPEGLLSIRIEDKDPEMAAKIANTFVDELDKLNQQITYQRAKENRTFIEERLGQVKSELDSVQHEFEQFQIDNRAVDFGEQTRLAIEQAINLKKELINLEIDLKMSREVMSDDNPEIIEKKRKRDIVKNELDQLESSNRDTSFFSLPVAEIPTLKGQYENLYRRVKVNESLYSILLEQLEQAKIKEHEEIPSITVLDRAVPPEMRSRPRRTLIVSASFGLSFLAALFLAFMLEYFRNLREKKPEDYARAANFLRAYLGWIPGMKKALK